MANYRVKKYLQSRTKKNKYFVQKKWLGLFWYNMSYNIYHGNHCCGIQYYCYTTEAHALEKIEGLKKLEGIK